MPSLDNYPPGHPTGFRESEQTFECPLDGTRWNVAGIEDRATNSWVPVDEKGNIGEWPICPNHDRIHDGAMKMGRIVSRFYWWCFWHLPAPRFLKNKWSRAGGSWSEFMVPQVTEYDQHLSILPDEEYIPEYNPGDEVDDEGGMSEHRWEGYDERD